MDKGWEKKGGFRLRRIAKKSVLLVHNNTTQLSGCITILKETSFHYISPSSFSFALALDTFFVSQNTAVTERWEPARLER